MMLSSNLDGELIHHVLACSAWRCGNPSSCPNDGIPLSGKTKTRDEVVSNAPATTRKSSTDGPFHHGNVSSDKKIPKLRPASFLVRILDSFRELSKCRRKSLFD